MTSSDVKVADARRKRGQWYRWGVGSQRRPAKAPAPPAMSPMARAGTAPVLGSRPVCHSIPMAATVIVLAAAARTADGALIRCRPKFAGGQAAAAAAAVTSTVWQAIPA